MHELSVFFNFWEYNSAALMQLVRYTMMLTKFFMVLISLTFAFFPTIFIKGLDPQNSLEMFSSKFCSSELVWKNGGGVSLAWLPQVRKLVRESKISQGQRKVREFHFESGLIFEIVALISPDTGLNTSLHSLISFTHLFMLSVEAPFNLQWTQIDSSLTIIYC